MASRLTDYHEIYSISSSRLGKHILLLTRKRALILEVFKIPEYPLNDKCWIEKTEKQKANKTSNSNSHKNQLMEKQPLNSLAIQVLSLEVFFLHG